MLQKHFSGLSTLTLGCAQLGMDYGVANRSGRPAADVAAAILDAAANAGVTCLDTARGYGESEAAIGAWLRRGRRPLLVTKLGALAAASDIATGLAASLAALGVGRVDALLLHGAAGLGVDGAVAALRRERDAGRIGTFGVSLYTPEQLEVALALPDVGAVQLPASLVDQRFASGGWIDRCAERGVAVFIRSVYLQGLLLQAPEALPPAFAELAPAVRRLRGLAAEAGLDPAAAALAFIRDLPGVTSVVVGAETPEQIRGSVAAWRVPALSAELRRELARLGDGLPAWIADPRAWPKP